MNNTIDIPTRLREGGWKPLQGAGRFMALAGPLWAAREGDGWAYGVVSTDEHLNPAGVVHGGLLATPDGSRAEHTRLGGRRHAHPA